MKKLITTTLACSLLGLTAYAQGTIAFGNIIPASPGFPAINAPMFQSDGTTKLGSSYMAGLYAGPSAGSMNYIGGVSFLSGGGAGYWANTTETIATMAPGATAFVQIVIWDHSAFATDVAAHNSGLANVWAESSMLSLTLGGGGSPPAVPTPIEGLTSLSLTVPEPSTLALAGLGAAALTILRRRK